MPARAPVLPGGVPALGALLCVLLLLGSGCAGTVRHDQVRTAGGSFVGLNVTGDPGTAPGVRIAAPLRVDATRSEIVVTGAGAAVQVDRQLVLALTLYDARTGKPAGSTYDPGRQPLVVKNTDDSLFPALAAALVGVRQGSRLVAVLTGADAFGGGGTPPAGVRRSDPLVAVADVLAVPPVAVLDAAVGRTHPAPPDAPRVVVGETGPTRVAFAGAAEPRALTVIALVEGRGPRVRDHSLVAIDHLDQPWDRRYPTTSTYFKEPIVVGVGTVGSDPVWDRALVGVRQGSRLLVLVPTGVGSHPSTARVVDVLGVS